MDSIAVAARRGKDGGGLGNITLGASKRFHTNGERKLHSLHRPAAFVRWQKWAWRHDDWCWNIGLGAVQNQTARGPSRQSWTPQPDAFHVEPHYARPRRRL